MNMKYFIKRLLILVIPIILMLVFHFITFDEHKRCIGNVHRHVDGFLGIVMLIGFWLFIWLILMIIELIFNLLKKHNAIKQKFPNQID